jgi:hypothetical protein
LRESINPESRDVANYVLLDDGGTRLLLAVVLDYGDNGALQSVYLAKQNVCITFVPLPADEVK